MKTRTIITALLVLCISSVNCGAAKTVVAHRSAAFSYENNPASGTVSGIQVNAKPFAEWDLECLSSASELPLTLEPWMTEGTTWKIQVSEENPLDPEPWMPEEENWISREPDMTLEKQEKADNGFPVNNTASLYVICLPQEFEGHIGSECWKTDDHVWCNEYSVMVFTDDGIDRRVSFRGCKGPAKAR